MSTWTSSLSLWPEQSHVAFLRMGVVGWWKYKLRALGGKRILVDVEASGREG